MIIGFAAIDLAGMAQPDHVLGEVAVPLIQHMGLRHHEGLKPAVRNSASTAAVGV